MIGPLMEGTILLRLLSALRNHSRYLHLQKTVVTTFAYRKKQYKNIYTARLMRNVTSIYILTVHFVVMTYFVFSDLFQVCLTRLRKRRRFLDRRGQSRCVWGRMPWRTRSSDWSYGGWFLLQSAWGSQPWKVNENHTRYLFCSSPVLIEKHV